MHPDIPLRDPGRTLLVVSERPDLVAALSAALPSTAVTLIAAGAHEVEDHLKPERWPFMLVSDQGGELSTASQMVLRLRPVLLYWRGTPPAGLPGHARGFPRFQDLLRAIREALDNRSSGMMLAPTHGVELPSGAWVGSPPLQALVAAHPLPFNLPRTAFGGVSATLSRHQVPWRLRTAEGWVRLVPLDEEQSR
jgi:hypothetical protein